MFIIIIITVLKLRLDCGTAAPRGRQTLGHKAGQRDVYRNCGTAATVTAAPRGLQSLTVIFQYSNKY